MKNIVKDKILQRILLVIIPACLIVVLFLNNKLNNQFNEVREDIKEMTRDLSKNIDSALKRPSYDFSEFESHPVPNKYNVKKEYFLLSNMAVIKKDYSKDENGVLLTN